jgi:prepilin-type N-terminal cleavage/methylation domain-containing protein
MGHRARRRAFTLIEAMLVVVVIGILSVLAIVAYRRWVQAARLSEAQDMVANIRTAEENFRAENGGYLNVSDGLGDTHDYPAPHPGVFKTGWGGPCTTCNGKPAAWQALAVQPNGPVYFGYSVVADPAPIPSPGGLNLAGLAGQPWYVVEADGELDGDGDGDYTQVIGQSATNQIMVLNEGQ